MTQNQPPILIHRDTRSLTSTILTPEVTNKHHCKLDEILKKNFLTIICDFRLFLSITQVYVAFAINSQIKVPFFSDTTVHS